MKTNGHVSKNCSRKEARARIGMEGYRGRWRDGGIDGRRRLLCLGGVERALPRRQCQTGSFGISKISPGGGVQGGAKGEEISGSGHSTSKLMRAQDTQLDRAGKRSGWPYCEVEG